MFDVPRYIGDTRLDLNSGGGNFFRLRHDTNLNS